MKNTGTKGNDVKVYCLICKKHIKNVETAGVVQMSTLGRVWTEANAPTLPENQNQGWFEVGSDCLRKVDATGTVGYAL